MSIEQSSGRFPESTDTLKTREQILVKSASIIDEHPVYQTIEYGRLFWAEWTDRIDGMNFQLQALGERMHPQKVAFTYRLLGYDTIRSPQKHQSILAIIHMPLGLRSETNRANIKGVNKKMSICCLIVYRNSKQV